MQLHHLSDFLVASAFLISIHFCISLAYIPVLQATLKKRLLAAGPSSLFALMLIVSALIGAFSGSDHGVQNALELIPVAIAVASVCLIVFNLFYVPTSLHWLQIGNVIFGAVSLYLSLTFISKTP